MNRTKPLVLTKRERNELIHARYADGYSQEEIGKFYGLSQSRVSAILVEKRRGLPERLEETRGMKSRLNEEDLNKLAELLKKSRDGEDFSHWNKWSLKQLIKDTFDVEYHENYIWEVMRKIGFTSQRPQKKDYRQNPEKVEIFKNKDALDIKKIR